MSTRALYPTSGSTEPDIRKEFKNTMDGGYPEISKAQKALFRKMRRNASNELTKCPCVDSVTDEPDIDIFCPVCHGEGYLWDESYIEVYKIDQRNELIYKAPIMVFYCRSSIDITEKDRIIELVLDEEGKLTEPVKRKARFKIKQAIDFRSDNGRLEYWKLDCYEKAYKFLNGVQL
tara:strand:+ start:302 stop:829 length:528 start_codon:yes stop_codon:yes gene_type:complete